MKRRLIAIASALALSLGLTVPAGAQFIVETQAQTTVEAVLQEFPSPTPEDLLEIRNRSAGGAPLDASGGYPLTDPTMGYGANVVISSAPAELAILSIPHYEWETDDKPLRDSFVFQVPVGTVISSVDAGAWGLDFLSRKSVDGEVLYSNTYFNQVDEYVAVTQPMPITIETTDIYTFGFTDSIYGYVYVQGVEDMETDPAPEPGEMEPADETGIQFADVSAEDYFAAPWSGRWKMASQLVQGRILLAPTIPVPRPRSLPSCGAPMAPRPPQWQRPSLTYWKTITMPMPPHGLGKMG